MVMTGASPTSYDAERVAGLSNDEVSNILVRTVRKSVERYYPGVAPASWSIACKAWGGQETARTFRLDLKDKSRERREVLYVKLCPIFESVNPSRLEYETLELLYDAMPRTTNRFWVSRPVDFYPELNAYAMESVVGRNLRTYLLRFNSRGANEASVAALSDSIVASAQWLRAFHELTESGKAATFEAKEFYDSITGEFDYRQLRAYRFRQEVLDRLDRVLQRLEDLSGKFTLPCAKWHWDYTPGHIFLDHGRISVIDILGADDSPVYEDVGRFLASISTLNNLPWHPFFDHDRASGQLNEVFLRAYGCGGVSEPVFRMFAAVYKLKHLLYRFFGQHFRVSTKIHPQVGALFANYHLVGLYERQLEGLCDDLLFRIAIVS